MASDLPRLDVQQADEYFYRRSMGLRDIVPAIGVGVSAGLLAFYVAKLFLERTPLRAPEGRVRPGGGRSAA